MRITLCLSARCTLTYAPSGSPTSSLQGSPHYHLRPAATLRNLTGLPLYWDASSPERRTAQWRARPAERHADGRLRSQPSHASCASPAARPPHAWRRRRLSSSGRGQPSRRWQRRRSAPTRRQQRTQSPTSAASLAPLIAGACQGAGIRPLGCAKRGGSSAVGLPHWAARQFRLRELRAALRQARRQHRGAAEHVTARRALQRATQRAERAARSVRGTQLERQLLEQHDAAGFHQTYRGPQGGVPDFVLREPDAVLAHFLALLAPPTAASPPEGSTAAGGRAGAAPQEGSVAEAAAALAAAQQATQADMQAAVSPPQQTACSNSSGSWSSIAPSAASRSTW